MAMQHILLLFIKWSSLQISVCKFTHFFRELEHCMAMQQVLLMFIKWSRLQISVCKFKIVSRLQGPVLYKLGL